ncbi:hypothetical protein [Phaeovulum sp.]|uniref:hypothetical protein n=1 Tax=Phaeovulum sp. TaxID=2934796 RepID=UPI0035697AF3
MWQTGRASDRPAVGARPELEPSRKAVLPPIEPVESVRVMRLRAAGVIAGTAARWLLVSVALFFSAIAVMQLDLSALRATIGPLGPWVTIALALVGVVVLLQIRNQIAEFLHALPGGARANRDPFERLAADAHAQRPIRNARTRTRAGA